MLYPVNVGPPIEQIMSSRIPPIEQIMSSRNGYQIIKLTSNLYAIRSGNIDLEVDNLWDAIDIFDELSEQE